MRQPRPLSQEERDRREAEARRQAELALQADMELALDKYENVLNNLFEMLKDNYPTLDLDQLNDSRDDKHYVIQSTAKVLLRYDGKLNEKNLENSHYLNKLAFRLLNNMIANYVLNQHELRNEDERQKNAVKNFEHTLEPLRNDETLTPEVTGLFDLFIEGLNEAFNEKGVQDIRSPQQQNRIGSALDKMKDSLYEMEKVNPELSDEITELTQQFFKKMEKLGEEAAQRQEQELGKEINDNCSTVFKEMSKLTPRPQPSGGSTAQTEEEKQKEMLAAGKDPSQDPLNQNAKTEEAVVDYISGGRMVTLINHFGKGQNLQIGHLFPPIFDEKAGDPDLKDQLLMKPSTAPTPFRTTPNPIGD